MKKTILFILAILASLTSYTQKVEWADFVYSRSGFNPGMGVVSDAAGNIYTLGEIQDSIIIEGDSLTNQYGSIDLILIKYTQQGTYLWAKVFGGTGSDEAFDLAIDAAGHLYASVSIQGVAMMSDTTYNPPFNSHVIQFDTASNFHRYISKNGQMLVDATGNDVYIAYASTVEKLDTTYSTIWSRTASSTIMTFSNYGPQGDIGDIMVGNNGHLVVSGHENGAGGACTFDTISLSFAPLTGAEIFVISMDTSGSAFWAKTLDSSSAIEEWRPEVAIDDAGNVYFGFESEGDTIVFANDTLFHTPATSNYNALLKYNASGIPQWGIGYYTLNGSAINDIIINAQQDMVICGSSSGNGSFGNYILSVGGQSNPYVSKVNAAGVVQWYKTDDVIAFAATTYFQSLDMTPNGDYAVTGFYHPGYKIGCFSAPPNSRDIITAVISENPEPSAAFTYTWSGLTFTFTDQSIGATSWDWNFGDGDTSTLQNPVHTYLTTGNYAVSLYINDSLCRTGGLANIVDTIAVGITEANLALQNVTLGENPFCDFLVVYYSATVKGKINYEITDATGKMIRAGSFESKQGNTYRIPVSDLNIGIYFITINNNNHQKTFKAVKVN